MQAGSDLVGIRPRLEGDWFSDSHLHGGWFCEMFLLLLERKQSINANGHDWQVQAGREPANAAAEFVDLPGLGALAFGKNHDAVAPLHALGGVVKAFAISSALRQREDVKERGNQHVVQLFPPAP